FFSPGDRRYTGAVPRRRHQTLPRRRRQTPGTTLEKSPMPLDHYVTLGRSGLRVSPLCLGAMTFGEDWGIGVGPGECNRVMDRYRELGGNFIDTANGYSWGHSEKIIGDHIGRHPVKRHQMVIATKFFANMGTGDPNAGGAGRKNILWACEESLRRLQTDYIDLYWMHLWDRHTPIEETLRALDDLVSAGKVRHIGFSDTPAWKTAQAQGLAALHHWEPVIALQLEYSLLGRTIEGEYFPMSRGLGLGLSPWRPLRPGRGGGAGAAPLEPAALAAAARHIPARRPRRQERPPEPGHEPPRRPRLRRDRGGGGHRRTDRRHPGPGGTPLGLPPAGDHLPHHRRPHPGAAGGQPRLPRDPAGRHPDENPRGPHRPGAQLPPSVPQERRGLSQRRHHHQR